MSTLHAAFFLILAGGTTSAFAERIACESDQDRLEACTTVLPGSRIRLVEQLSRTPCVEGRNWGVDTTRNSIWTSGGCRAVFDVQPPRNDPYSKEYRGDEPLRDEPRRDPQYADSLHAHADGVRTKARDACIDQAMSGSAFGPGRITAGDARWIGHGLFAVGLDTPDGPLTCTVDPDGNVRSMDGR